jgi:heparosan-N-sulfate-glucuronate 5-epimerase
MVAVTGAKWLVALAAVIFTAVVAAARADTGPYLDSASWGPIEASTVVGPEGVPQVRYSWGVEDNPVTVAQWGLQHWSWFKQTGGQADLNAAIKASDWLLAHQRSDGAWEFDFEFNGAGVRMRAPWISALSQGQAMSLLVRVHSVTGEQRYLDSALQALAPLQKPIADGGAAADWDGVLWLEEYPTDDPQHVLNGFEYTLVGLDDLADASPAAQSLFDQGIGGLVARIAVFDVPEHHTQYYAARGGGRVLATAGYPRYHAVLTRALATITGDATLAGWATRWEQYLAYRPPLFPRQPAVPPATAPPATPAPSTTRPPCRFRGDALRIRGRLSCRAAKRTIRRYARSRVAPARWRCHTGRRLICRRGELRVSASRSALR